MSATNREGGGGVGSRVGSGRVRHRVGRVGSDNWLLKSGWVQTLVGRVGSEKLDPETTLSLWISMLPYIAKHQSWHMAA